MKKILIVAKTPTHPTTAGNRWGILAQAEILKKLGNEVYFLYVEERAMSRGKTKEFDNIFKSTKEYWGDKFLHYRVPTLEKAWFNIKKRFYAYTNTRQKCDTYYPVGLTSFVKKVNNQYHFDICIVNYYFMTKLFDHVSFDKKACFTHDNYVYKDIRLGCKTGECDTTADANQMAKAMHRSPHIFAVQDDEKIFFEQLSPKSKVYNIYSKYDYHPQPIAGNHNIMFLSGNNGFNQNGIKWFIKDVFPLILKRFPDAKLMIGGGICKVMQELKNVEGVDMLGYVDSLDEFYRLGDVAINPVYQGTGLKIKTFEALSYDKVTLVHPHSMAGVYKKNEAQMFDSEKQEEWVKFLETVWDNPKRIEEIKKHNAAYMKEMNEFIISEYKRFLEA